jgi:hypothetical protein
MFAGDVQCYDNNECLKNKTEVFQRCDLIVSQSYEYFSKIFPQFLSKMFFLADCFSTHEKYLKFPFNEKPKMKCLLSGSTGQLAYPLRYYILKNKIPQIEHKNSFFALGEEYPKLLNSYFCCVTCSSIFKYVLTKHLEIPAAGSLLLTNETSDLNRVGFIPYKHYIPITKNDVFQKIKDCLNNPQNYNKIRQEGMIFTRENHSIKNRLELFKEVFNKVMNKESSNNE